MRMRYCSLMRAQEPALQQRRHAMRSGQQVLAHDGRRPDNLVPIAFGFQTSIATPAIGQDLAAWLYTSADRRHQDGARSVGDAGQTNAPDLRSIRLGRNKDQPLTFGPAASLARPLPAYIRLINFTVPANRSRPGRTMARRSLCSQRQAVR